MADSAEGAGAVLGGSTSAGLAVLIGVDSFAVENPSSCLARSSACEGDDNAGGEADAAVDGTPLAAL